MKRFTPIFILILFVGALLLYEVKLETASVKPPPPNIPVIATIHLYTDVPNGVSSALAQDYELTHHVKVKILPFTEKQLLDKIKTNALQDGDVILTNKDNLLVGTEYQRFKPFVSEQIDLVSDQFKNTDNLWVGLWYDPVVFAINENFYKKEGKSFVSWRSMRKYGDFTIVMPDFVTSPQAANILYSFVEERGRTNGLAYFISVKEHVTQYTKFLNTAVRLAALGEVDIGIGNYSDAALYGKKQYQIKMIFPEDGTPYYLYGAAILKNTKKDKEAKQFLDWLLSKDVYSVLRKSNYYYIYTNPEIAKPRDALNKEPLLMKVKGNYTEQGREELLNAWIKTVRF